MAPRLIVISNRVAQPAKHRPAAGGLAVAVEAALKRLPGIWFGWSGRLADKSSNKIDVSNLGGTTYMVTDLGRADFQEYYNGFANRVLWPILHYRVDLAEFNRSDLTGYLRVNEFFAGRLESILRPDDILWVHDYHLMPLAWLLRSRGVRNRIGFFLHVPCPPADLLFALPHHREILGSLLAYDLVGLQTANDRENLVRYLERQGSSVSLDRTVVNKDGRSARFGVFPVGIDAQNFMEAAGRAINTAAVQEMKDSLVGRSLAISVDRLDYSKGLTQRMDAINTFLEVNSDWRGRVTFLQIAPKSRAEIREYAETDRLVSSAAGQINGRFGEVSWTPIRYINRTYSRNMLAGLYRLARVGLVTPIRDGMNLVAKEFVAAQDPADPGALVLSQFAGAASEFKDALVVNPHEPEAVAGAIRTALEMPLAERKLRHQGMLEAVETATIDRWAELFLDDLATAQPEAEPPPPKRRAA
jgi:trehalose 6-phosphate synthase